MRFWDKELIFIPEIKYMRVRNRWKFGNDYCSQSPKIIRPKIVFKICFLAFFLPLGSYRGVAIYQNVKEKIFCVPHKNNIYSSRIK